MEDSRIIELYLARDEQAIAETGEKYGGFCYSLADSILHSARDAEETVSDTYLHTWNAIPPQQPTVLKMFLAKITRNLAFSRWRSLSAVKRGRGQTQAVLDELEFCIPDTGSVEDELNAKELADEIRSFLDTQSKREQDIFLRRYFFLEEMDTIARRYGMQRATVLRSLSRTRQKLKDYLTKEGYDL